MMDTYQTQQDMSSIAGFATSIMAVGILGYFAKKLLSSPKSPPAKKLKGLIDAVPDVNDPALINYWKTLDDKLVYLEGWCDECLAGTGFPPIEGGEWDEKIDYIKGLTPEILHRKAKEYNLELLEGGFVEKTEEDYPEYLYGVTYGVYQRPKPPKLTARFLDTISKFRETNPMPEKGLRYVSWPEFEKEAKYVGKAEDILLDPTMRERFSDVLDVDVYLIRATREQAGFMYWDDGYALIYLSPLKGVPYNLMGDLAHELKHIQDLRAGKIVSNGIMMLGKHGEAPKEYFALPGEKEAEREARRYE